MAIMEKIAPEYKSSEFEQEISKEKIDKLSDREEPGAYYRGLKAEDALKAIFGKLNLSAEPENDIIGSRDNASINLHDSIYFAPSSQTKEGKKFLCAIGFDVLSDSKIENSILGKSTFVRITGPVATKEIVVRFAGKKTGSPQKKVFYFSPREFYEWYKENTD